MGLDAVHRDGTTQPGRQGNLSGEGLKLGRTGDQRESGGGERGKSSRSRCCQETDVRPGDAPTQRRKDADADRILPADETPLVGAELARTGYLITSRITPGSAPG